MPPSAMSGSSRRCYAGSYAASLQPEAGFLLRRADEQELGPWDLVHQQRRHHQSGATRGFRVLLAYEGKQMMSPHKCPLKIKNHQLSWWFDGEPLKAVLKDSATFGMGLWDH